MTCRCKLLERRPLQPVFDRETPELTWEDLCKRRYIRFPKGPIVLSDI